jgi:hypothetical protein
MDAANVVVTVALFVVVFQRKKKKRKKLIILRINITDKEKKKFLNTWRIKKIIIN